jgi:septum formation protein
VRLYLASTSPARLALLRQLGIEPVVVPSQVDEEAAVRRATDENGELDASAMVTLLARLKAEAILGQLPEGAPIDGVILGGDSAFELDGVIYGKPHEPEVARERWLAQRGKTGTLHSGHWLIEVTDGVAGRALGATAHASVEFAADISEQEVDAYVASGEPLQVAGAFTVDGLAAPFIRSVTGAPSTVIGMSLPTLRTMLAELGIDWMSLRA